MRVTRVEGKVREELHNTTCHMQLIECYNDGDADYKQHYSFQKPSLAKMYN